jgi:thiol peroxidase
MAVTHLKGTPVNTSGDLPSAGTPAPDFSLTRTDLTDVVLEDFKGRRVVLNIFPSVDTPICSASVRRFNAETSGMDNTVVLCISRDLPFALKRFCEAEGLDDVIPLSEMRRRRFGDAYGVTITDGPLAGLLARSVVVIDENGRVLDAYLVPEIGEEPDYNRVLALLSGEQNVNVCVASATAEHSRGFEEDDPCDDGR